MPQDSRSAAATAMSVFFIFAIAVAVAYSNSLSNAFALDDWHSIEANPWIRSLANVPAFFRDPSTFSTLRTNVDYRPVLQATYALNFAWSGDDTWSWHLVNLAIHFAVAVSLFLLGRRLVGSGGLAPLTARSPGIGDLAALVAAVLFAVHPITSGCVNYVSARSSSLVAALTLPALVIYLGALGRPRVPPRIAAAVVLYALALLTKVEAVSFVLVLVLAELLLDPTPRIRPGVRRLAHRTAWGRIAPFLAVTIAYLVLWRSLSPLAASPALAPASVTPLPYFLTQLRAWWHYVGLVVAPTNLVADDPTFPLSHAITDPGVLVAAAGWACVAALALGAVRTAPVATFLVGCFFAFLLPHSSFVPLAEPVNEHRPYLPVAFLFPLATAAAAAALAARTRRAGALLVALGVLLAAPLVMLTRERNLVWRDDLSLWGDTVSKVPDSPRAQMNFGLALLARGRIAEAEDRFRRATRLAPGYSYAWTNLGIALAAQGRDAQARQAFDAGARLAPHGDAPYYWRGRFRAARADDVGAVADLEAAARNSSAAFREWAALSELHRFLGDEEAAAEAARRTPAGAETSFAAERAAFRSAVLGQREVRAVELVNAGVDLMSRADLAAAEDRFREALRFDHASHLAWTNLGIVRIARGDLVRGLSAHDMAVRAGAGDPSPWLWRARSRANAGDLAGAIEDLRTAAAIAPEPSAGLAELSASIERLSQERRPPQAVAGKEPSIRTPSPGGIAKHLLTSPPGTRRRSAP
jgi:tetratricopeptide (TPR) repeat protein